MIKRRMGLITAQSRPPPAAIPTIALLALAFGLMLPGSHAFGEDEHAPVRFRLSAGSFSPGSWSAFREPDRGFAELPPPRLATAAFARGRWREACLLPDRAFGSDKTEACRVPSISNHLLERAACLSPGLRAVEPGADLPRTSSAAERPWWRVNLIRRVLSDQPFLVARWWPQDLRRPGFTAPLVLGIAAAAGTSRGDFARDKALADWTNDHAQGRLRRAAHGFTSLGNSPTYAVLLGTSWLVGRKRGDDRLAGTASLATEALIDAAIWSSTIKAITGRLRPVSGGEGEFFQYGLWEGADEGSFPSGHAINSFAVATVFARQYEDKRWVPWVAYGTAALISISRVAVGQHYPSDVLAGSLLGDSIGRMVLARSREETGLPSATLRPLFDSKTRSYGIEYVRSW